MLTIFIFCFIVLVLIAIIVKKRYSVYKYNVSKDYIYDFASAAEIRSVYLEQNVLQNFKVDKSCDTAMAEVDIETTLVGKIKQPYITVVQNKVEYRQYFEYGAKGKRYVDLSCAIAEESPIIIHAHACKIKAREIKVFLYNNNINNKQNICIIAPHPDDAEIAAYGLYSSYENAHILTISASESGKQMYKELDLDNSEQAILKGKTRTVNSLSVPLLAGVKSENCINYGYFGDTLKPMYDNKKDIIDSQIKSIKSMDVFRHLNTSNKFLKDTYESSWSSLVNDLQFSLEKIQPGIIVLPYPQIDTHPDHKYSTIAVIEAIKALGLKKGKLLLYTNHHVLSEAYPYGREHSIVSLPPHFGEGLYFDSIVSFGLDKHKQIEKTIALEGMNVLRPFYPWQKNFTIVNRVFKNQINKIYGKRLDYFTRSIRSNELFFVVDFENIDKLLLT